MPDTSSRLNTTHGQSCGEDNDLPIVRKFCSERRKRDNQHAQVMTGEPGGNFEHTAKDYRTALPVPDERRQKRG